MILCVGEDVEQLELSYTADQNVKWHTHLENSLTVSYKVKYTPTI